MLVLVDSMQLLYSSHGFEFHPASFLAWKNHHSEGHTYGTNTETHCKTHMREHTKKKCDERRFKNTKRKNTVSNWYNSEDLQCGCVNTWWDVLLIAEEMSSSLFPSNQNWYFRSPNKFYGNWINSSKKVKRNVVSVCIYLSWTQLSILPSYKALFVIII